MSEEELPETSTSENKIFTTINDEFVKCAEELVLTIFLMNPSEAEMIVSGALYTWLAEGEPKSFISEAAMELTYELYNKKSTLSEFELRERFREFTNEKQEGMVNERLLKMIAAEYTKLKEEIPSEKTDPDELPSDEIIELLAEHFIRLSKIKEERDLEAKEFVLKKLSEAKSTNVLEEGFMQLIAQRLHKLNEEEFQTYKHKIMNELKEQGVKKFDTDILQHWYMIMAEELYFLMISRASKFTSIDFINSCRAEVLGIFKQRTVVQSEKSVFGQLFIASTKRMALALEDTEYRYFSDDLVRVFIQNEFKKSDPGMMKLLEYEAMNRYIVQAYIEVAQEPEILKNEAGQLLLENISDAIASDMFWFVDTLSQVIAARLAELRTKETNEIIDTFMKRRMLMTRDKFSKLIHFVERRVFTITAKALSRSTEDLMEFVETELPKLLNWDTMKSIKENWEVWRDFMEEQLEEWIDDEYADLDEDELDELVTSKYEMVTHIGLFDETVIADAAYMRLLAEEFINLHQQLTDTVMDVESNKFGETAKRLTSQLLTIAATT